MLKRILIIWFVANFLIVGIVCWLADGWYLGWSPLAGMLTELGLIMLPNVLLPILTLKYWWPQPISDVRLALGWRDIMAAAPTPRRLPMP